MSIFITGATGFLGSQLLPLLNNRREKLLLLVRNPSSASLRLALTGFQEQIEFIQGDLYQPSLGINNDTWDLYKNDITEIWHCAANLSFNSKDREAVTRCNLDGTISLLGKAKECPNLKRLYYVSTAFVHGDCDDLVKEDVLLPENSIRFLNYYEESKYKAEQQIRNSGLPFTIFRPAIIMGNSVSGEASSTVTYFGFYNALQKAFTNGRHTPIPGMRLRVEGINGRRNHICVDHLARMLYDIAVSGKDLGRTFHLAYGEQGRVSDIFEAINRCLRSHFMIQEKVERTSLNLTEVLARKLSVDYHSYIMRHDPLLDRTNTLSVLGYDFSLHISLADYLFKMYSIYQGVLV